MAPVSKYSKITRIRKTNPFKKMRPAVFWLCRVGFTPTLVAPKAVGAKAPRDFLFSAIIPEILTFIPHEKPPPTLPLVPRPGHRVHRERVFGEWGSVWRDGFCYRRGKR